MVPGWYLSRHIGYHRIVGNIEQRRRWVVFECDVLLQWEVHKRCLSLQELVGMIAGCAREH